MPPMGVSVDNLVWSAGRRESAPPILRGVTFDAAPGAFVGIVGPNGAGKSSLLRCIYRFNRPWSGHVAVGGNDVWRLSARESARRTAVVLQDGGEAVGLTVVEVVELGRLPHLALFGGDASADRRIVAEALSIVGMSALATRPLATLSGGERQRVMLARAIAQRPAVLVLDEPTNHLDPRYQIEILRIVRDLGVTVIAAMHDLNQAAMFCDRIVMIRDGTIVADGPPDETLSAAAIESLYGVSVLVDRNPRSGRPRVSFDG